MLRKRHHSEEIAAKLHEAEEMAAQGKTQQEIARALGVSVMTVHRWRKRRDDHPAATMLVRSLPDGAAAAGTGIAAKKERREEHIVRLELENSRLRRLVADLLLEKIKLEEELQEEQQTAIRLSR